MALEKLKLMWPSCGSKSTEDLMMHQFAKHALIAENNYKVNYFKKTLDAAAARALFTTCNEWWIFSE